MPASAPEPLSALHGVAAPGRHAVGGEAPLTLRERRPSLAMLLARKARARDVAAAVQRRFGLALPAPGRAAAAQDASAIWTQPDGWLLSADGAAARDFAGAVKSAVGDAGSVVDQTHGKAVLLLTGAPARRVLATGCRIDLHPRVFAPGRSAVTQIAHIDCILRQVDAAPGYELIVPSSLAEAFYGWLTHAASAYGYEVLAPA
ncbi:MAG: sarcosine oxidase subunit gamma [Alphaproteobacteria bacterium]|nr:sarcosine oxidase subunit gamma [Alphaproteobacteria bacterium]